MQQRGSPVSSAAVSRGTRPLVSLPPVSSAFHLKVVWYGPTRAAPVAEPKRFKVSATIQIEGDVTAEELRELFLPAERLGGRVSVSAALASKVATPSDEPTPEELERRARLTERANHLANAYRDKLDDGPTYLTDSLEQWLKEGWTETDLRSAIDETAKAPGLNKTGERYQYMREVLRIRRREGGEK